MFYFIWISYLKQKFWIYLTLNEPGQPKFIKFEIRVKLPPRVAIF